MLFRIDTIHRNGNHVTNDVTEFIQKLLLYEGLYGNGNGNPLQYSCLGKPMDRGAWWTRVCGVTKNQTHLSDKHVAHTLWSMTNSCPIGILGWSRLLWAPRMRELTWQGVQGPSRRRWTFSLSLSLAHQCIMPKNWRFFRSGTKDYASTMSYSKKCFS